MCDFCLRRLIGACIFLCFANVVFAQKHISKPLYTSIPEKNLNIQEMAYLETILQDITNYKIELIEVDKSLLLSNQKLNLPFDNSYAQPLTIQKSKINFRNANSFSWFGKIENQLIAHANFVNHDGFIHGLIMSEDGVWEIEPLSKEFQVLTYKDPTKYEKEECELIDYQYFKQKDIRKFKPANGVDIKNTNIESNLTDCKIRLLVAYTDIVAASHADPLGHIQLATDLYNQTNDNSNVNHDVELARIVEVSYVESNNSTTDLNRFSGTSDGFMDTIHTLRDLYDADMCCLILEQTSGCGRAEVIGASASTAFQVTEYSCATGNLTFTHEFGHLLNARHDWLVDWTSGSNHGYASPDSLWRTCMSYNDVCDCDNEAYPCPPYPFRNTPGTPFCNRIQYWSNPSINYPLIGGTPTGVYGQQPADNHTAINSYDEIVAGFQTYVNHKTISTADDILGNESAYIIANNSIETDTSVNIIYHIGSAGEYKAGDEIILRSGFWAKSGSVFDAVLENCTDNFSTYLTSRDDMQIHGEITSPTNRRLNLFPNPAKNYIELEVGELYGRVIEIDIIDVHGHLIKNKTLNKDSHYGNITINIEKLTEGVYFTRIHLEEETISIPFIKHNF